jgi:hypothetical protein
MKKRSNNVLPFPSENPNGASLKLFAIIFYGFVAYLLTLGTGLSEDGDGLGVLVILGIVYNFFVRNRLHKTSYFKDNMLLLVILLVVFVLAFKMAMLLLLVLAVVYWFLVGKSGKEAPYFLRFHILTALILNFFLLMPYLLLNAVIKLIFQLVGLAGFGVLITPVMTITQSVLPLFFTGVIAGAAVWLSISAVMGRTPYIPVVTSNVRHWA